MDGILLTFLRLGTNFSLLFFSFRFDFLFFSVSFLFFYVLNTGLDSLFRWCCVALRQRKLKGWLNYYSVFFFWFVTCVLRIRDNAIWCVAFDTRFDLNVNRNIVNIMHIIPYLCDRACVREPFMWLAFNNDGMALCLIRSQRLLLVRLHILHEVYPVYMWVNIMYMFTIEIYTVPYRKRWKLIYTNKNIWVVWIWCLTMRMCTSYIRKHTHAHI